MSTSPMCPQCGQPGVKTEKLTGTDAQGQPVLKTVWLCELDHRFS